jgi:alanine dehydrogenase
VTTHRNPTYEVDGVVHYCVGNMPGAVARTSTIALTNVTLPWAVKLARHGAHRLAEMDHHFSDCINMDRGKLTNKPVAEAHGLQFAGAAA